ncbi:ABC transporter permease subunit [Streptomyces sp. SR27]|uniref:ABC transporter permease n=1 Tax=Streptomyces sp. SR27 TaxID=3076630 RepID=UPI00295C35C8|nr:ABC transporter permease subunit [Streptomyces sp. SR27]MDV9190627.1 ABC transporter permease subunit [Streptomyces sp. SR27]
MSTLALKGPYWVTVRQYRRTLWLAGVLVILALAAIGGLRIWDAQTPDTYVQGGYVVPSDENHGYGMLRWAMEYFSIGMVFLPLLVGAFVAGPLVARELESGTYKLSLTQSISPARWLGSKLVTAGAAALATMLALTAIFWVGWARVGGHSQLHWADRGIYEVVGTALTAYVLLGVAVGALVGQLIRRTLVAMAATGGIVGIVLLALGALRWDFLSVVTITGPAQVNASVPHMPDHDLIMGAGLLTDTGQRLPGWFCAPDGPRADCGTDEKIVGRYLDYHPQSHFWPTQLIESGIVLALAALALFLAFRVLRTRHP